MTEETKRVCDKCGPTDHRVMWQTLWNGKSAKLCGKCMYEENYGKPLGGSVVSK